MHSRAQRPDTPLTTHKRTYAVKGENVLPETAEAKRAPHCQPMRLAKLRDRGLHR